MFAVAQTLSSALPKSFSTLYFAPPSFILPDSKAEALLLYPKQRIWQIQQALSHDNPKSTRVSQPNGLAAAAASCPVPRMEIEQPRGRVTLVPYAPARASTGVQADQMESRIDPLGTIAQRREPAGASGWAVRPMIACATAQGEPPHWR